MLCDDNDIDKPYYVVPKRIIPMPIVYSTGEKKLFVVIGFCHSRSEIYILFCLFFFVSKNSILLGNCVIYTLTCSIVCGDDIFFSVI